MVDKDVKNWGGGKMSEKREILKKISITIDIQYLQSRYRCMTHVCATVSMNQQEEGGWAWGGVNLIRSATLKYQIL